MHPSNSTPEEDCPMNRQHNTDIVTLININWVVATNTLKIGICEYRVKLEHPYARPLLDAMEAF